MRTQAINDALAMNLSDFFRLTNMGFSLVLLPMHMRNAVPFERKI